MVSENSLLVNCIEHDFSQLNRRCEGIRSGEAVLTTHSLLSSFIRTISTITISLYSLSAGLHYPVLLISLPKLFEAIPLNCSNSIGDFMVKDFLRQIGIRKINST